MRLCKCVSCVFISCHKLVSASDGDSFQITDACKACLEQRTVFTQQVLEKSLNQMVSFITAIAVLCILKRCLAQSDCVAG
jgi:hypothetical protein